MMLSSAFVVPMVRLTQAIGDVWLLLVDFYVNVNFTKAMRCSFPLDRELEQHLRPARAARLRHLRPRMRLFQQWADLHKQSS
ncbi:hypothetical protein JTP94_08130 [Rhizobium lusitanum]|uniref:hypothetical protein n=1 Tax=Rhizobium sp. RCAM05973 TaxID=2994066 RepID=UPI0022EBFE2D|nr:hypothetical protein [Rhizobium sp. RCAM05973]MBM7045126.1 hypothetical protein [Rhizobium lusitanum]